MVIGAFARVFNGSSRLSSFAPPPPTGIRKPTSIPGSLRFLSPSPARYGSWSISAPKMRNEDAREFELSNLTDSSPPFDERCWSELWCELKDLSPYVSEYGLIYYRILVEIKWLLKLSQVPQVTHIPELSQDAQSFLQSVLDGFSLDDAMEFKNLERTHPVEVVVERFLMLKGQSHSDPEIAKVCGLFHFGCSSYDVDNLARGLMLKDALDRAILPAMDELISKISHMAEKYLCIPLLTDGQATTVGHVINEYAAGLRRTRQWVSEVKIESKFVSSYGINAAYPEIEWPRVFKEFVESLGFSYCPFADERDDMALVFSGLAIFNSNLIGFDGEIGGYTSSICSMQITKAGEIGFSTMPHKVNPIYFENSKDHLEKANRKLYYLVQNLPMSRHVEGFDDLAVRRAIREGFGHSLLAYKSTLQGISGLEHYCQQLEQADGQDPTVTMEGNEHGCSDDDVTPLGQEPGSGM